MAPPVSINYVGIIASVVASMVIGMIWYAPPVMGRKWMQLIGRTESEIRARPMMMPMAVAIFGALAMALVMAFLVDYAQATTPSEGALLGVLVWVGFVVTTQATNAVFEGRSNELTIINAAHYLVVIVAVGALTAMFPCGGFSAAMGAAACPA